MSIELLAITPVLGCRRCDDFSSVRRMEPHEVRAHRFEKSAAAVLPTPLALVLSHDRTLCDVASGAVESALALEVRETPRAAREVLARGAVRLVLVDDALLGDRERGWFLDQARRLAPDAFVVYVASIQDTATERQTRAHGVAYYTSRPLDAERLERVLRAFLRTLRAAQSVTPRQSAAEAR